MLTKNFIINVLIFISMIKLFSNQIMDDKRFDKCEISILTFSLPLQDNVENKKKYNSDNNDLAKDFRSGFWSAGWIILIPIIPLAIIGGILLSAGIPLLSIGLYKNIYEKEIYYSPGLTIGGSVCTGIGALFVLPIIIFGIVYLSVVSGDYLEKVKNDKVKINN